MNSNFYAMLARMKYINRWGLMRNTRNETLSEHCLDTAFIAHALVIIHNRKFGGNLNPEHAACLAMFHDASEIITGDMPTPVKYFNPEIRQAYKDIENVANKKLLSMLPEEFYEDYQALLEPDPASYEHMLIKAADKLAAYIKCVEELRSGNREFAKAESALRAEIEVYCKYEEVQYFMDTFIDTFRKTLDELE